MRVRSHAPASLEAEDSLKIRNAAASARSWEREQTAKYAIWTPKI